VARSPVQDYLERLHEEYAGMRDGAVADYIPPLADADPDAFGICLATTDGHLYEVGDTRVPFTIQSMSKPFTYGLALADRGRAVVTGKVGVEPSGDAFNSISLAPGSGQPRNPMINAGAIVSASLVSGATADERFARVLATYSRYAGRPLEVDEAVYASEHDTGHRNRAIGHMLRSFGVLDADVEGVLDRYFRQCSVLVDCRDIALMAATLANGGEHPVTGERALAPELVDSVLSVMTTCGMYDGAGAWVEGIGMPAKSGVAGGVLAVLPGELGLAVFSPPLDVHGNSARGVEICRRMSGDLSLHFLHAPRSHRSAIRRRYDIASVASRRRRPPAELDALAVAGGRAQVVELQGDLLFAAVEAVVRAIIEGSDEMDHVVVDLRGAGQLDAVAASLLADLSDVFAEEDLRLAFVDSGDHPELGIELAARDAASPPMFADADHALEWLEESLLDDALGADRPHGGVELDGHALCAGLDPEAVARLESLVQRRTFAPGDTIMRAGDPADELFLLLAGEVSIRLPGGVRLATLTPGMTFGELAVLDRAPRPVEAIADGAAEVAVLGAGDFEALYDDDPRLQAALLTNLLAGAYRHIGRATADILSLSGSHRVGGT
jgi:glutaminase